MPLISKAIEEKHLCIDYRYLNAKTKKDRYHMAAMNELIENLAGNNYFIVLDMTNAYYHIRIAENSRPFTAFVPFRQRVAVSVCKDSIQTNQ